MNNLFEAPANEQATKELINEAEFFAAVETATPDPNEAEIFKPAEPVSNEPKQAEPSAPTPDDFGYNFESNEQAKPDEIESTEASAAFLLSEIGDIVIPVLCVLVAKLAFKKTINAKELKATAAEKKLIAKHLEAVLKAANIKMDNPYINLAMAAASVYGVKIAFVLSMAKEAEAFENLSPDQQPNTNSQKPTTNGQPKRGRGRPRKQI